MPRGVGAAATQELARASAHSKASDSSSDTKSSGSDEDDDKYAKTRRELEAAIRNGDKKRSASTDSDDEGHRRAAKGPQTAAEKDYDQMEEEALHAEKLKSQV